MCISLRQPSMISLPGPTPSIPPLQLRINKFASINASVLESRFSPSGFSHIEANIETWLESLERDRFNSELILWLRNSLVRILEPFLWVLPPFYMLLSCLEISLLISGSQLRMVVPLWLGCARRTSVIVGLMKRYLLAPLMAQFSLRSSSRIEVNERTYLLSTRQNELRKRSLHHAWVHDGFIYASARN